MRGIYVPITEPYRRKLVDLARREHRDPRDQAAMMLETLLDRIGEVRGDDSALPFMPPGGEFREDVYRRGRGGGESAE